MSNAGFGSFRSGVQAADYDLLVASIKVALVRGYTFDPTHQFVSDVVAAGGVLNGTSAALTNPTLSNGVFDADDTTLTAAASASNHGLLVFQSSAVTGGADVAQNLQRVISYLDTGTGLPIQPGAGPVNITWAAGASKIHAITT